MTARSLRAVDTLHRDDTSKWLTLSKRDPFVRYGHGPILTPQQLPFKANAVLNPGAALVDGDVVLLIRVEDRRGLSQIHVARSANGVDGWRIEEQPFLRPGIPGHPFEAWGCEDPRITQVASRKWLIAYTASSSMGPAVALASTEDFVKVTRIGVALPPTNKDAAVFPQTFNGRWMMLHRPTTGGQENIWHAQSPELKHWSQPAVLLRQRAGPWWDGQRIGVGAPPIRTDHGWLLIYHGVKEMGDRPIYRLGIALLDLNNPRKVIARSSGWVFAAEADYEWQGLVPGVVYTCGALCRDDEVWMYYGAADTVIGLATAKLSDLLDFALG
jgi:predicted GH43/DUF377 family glycosyl hydrolase